ncbi:hypothetical protein QBC35DRAFT_538128 [Podospora australis]|uniref:Nucleoside phosphorylase domain-containing protein n=1 Tax=Podospora australis TaxID=1536484 RepID=A0AAN6WZF2_9PEZI|nr:hypothetical protein QBC35DRAFT_538128 [Podospora australis]
MAKLDNNSYTVGWICAITTEYVAARSFLDEIHGRPDEVARGDENNYTLGKMGKHNIVIAALPKDEYGTTSATAVAKDMLHSFPNIRIGLMVGIGGGAPSRKNDIRLGDIVVSSPFKGVGGVLQYDFGKTIQGRMFETTGMLNQPPVALRTAVTGLEAQYMEDGHQLQEAIEKILAQKPRLRKTHERPDPTSDRLYKSSKVHRHQDQDQDQDQERSCQLTCGNNAEDLVLRNARTEEDDDPAIHYGLIASANTLMKDAEIRDRLASERNVLCFEMEAAGLMNRFPCIVVRGICDYSDSHKNKKWQGYAAMTAAAYTKDLLAQIAPTKVEAESKIREVLESVRDDVVNTKENAKALRSRSDEQEDDRILNWIAPEDHSLQQSDHIRRREHGTGQWLLESDHFKAWLGRDNDTLFCRGVPGAGKTILTSAVVDRLLKLQTDSNKGNMGVAYVYCSLLHRNTQTAEKLLCILLKHLSRGLPALPSEVREMYAKHQRSKTRPSFAEITQCLQDVARHYRQTFVVVDALDESTVFNGCRSRFLTELVRLQEKCGTNIFATSRPIPGIEAVFPRCVPLEIRANETDIKRYLEANMFRLPAFVADDEKLWEDIKLMIVSAVCGMFLLAQFYLDSLIGIYTADAIRTALKDKSKTYDEMYAGNMNRIERSSEYQREFAKSVLSWIVFARRPLTLLELQHALAVSPGDPSLNPEKVPATDGIISACEGLVTVENGSGIVRLMHPTAQEYFEKHQDSWFPGAEARITAACLAYLSFDEFESGFCRNDADLEQRLRLHPFYHYAARNWGYHAGKVSSLDRHVGGFFGSQLKTEAAGQVLMASKEYSPWPDYSQEVPKQMTALHLAACFGATNVVRDLLGPGVDVNVQDSYQRTPLSWAVAFGHEDTVKLLLSLRGIEPDRKDVNGRTPLSLAAEDGYPAIVELLLEKASDPSARDLKELTPMSWAAKSGHMDVVKLIFANSKNLTGTQSHMPLMWAILNGSEEVVRTILGCVAKEDAQWREKNAPKALCWAAKNGRIPLFSLLFDVLETDINCRDDEDATPLMNAVIDDHEEMTSFILSASGVDINLKDKRGRSALSLAAEFGHDGLFGKLLAGDLMADVNSEDNTGRTPLSMAAGEGHETIVSRLLSIERVEVDRRDKSDQTPLFWAAKYGHDAVVKLLLSSDRGVDINALSINAIPMPMEDLDADLDDWDNPCEEEGLEKQDEWYCSILAR